MLQIRIFATCRKVGGMRNFAEFRRYLVTPERPYFRADKKYIYVTFSILLGAQSLLQQFEGLPNWIQILTVLERVLYENCFKKV